eukprot:UC1_evm2s1759
MVRTTTVASAATLTTTTTTTTANATSSVSADTTTVATPGDSTYEALRQRLLQVNTPAVSDADKEGVRAMDTRLRPLRQQGLNSVVPPFAGVARTVSCYNDFMAVMQGLSEAVAGEVLVIDTRGSTRTVGGELFATEARRIGLHALLIDGPCRDTQQIADMPDMPVYCTGVRPQSGTCRVPGETQVPVTCGGVVVRPGDIVFGDADGVVVLDLAQATQLIDTAEVIVRAEEDAVKAMLHEGKSLLDCVNYKEHALAVREGRPSALKFG